MTKAVTILQDGPTVEVVAQMELNQHGVSKLADWVAAHRPDCMPDNYQDWHNLFPHDLTREDGSTLSGNELLVELAGRKCYDSFGLKAGKRSNAEYIANTQSGEVKHASILYHAKISFFIGGVSRRVSHELIRNYVGSDRDEEGSPSQESTRFTHHYGFFICPPRRLGNKDLVESFRFDMQQAYDAYVNYVDAQMTDYEDLNQKKPVGIERKRIYEDAAGLLPGQAETSWIWTTNPMALAKLVRERSDAAADLEFQRLARALKVAALAQGPGMYPQPWMQTA